MRIQLGCALTVLLNENICIVIKYITVTIYFNKLFIEAVDFCCRKCVAENRMCKSANSDSKFTVSRQSASSSDCLAS